MEISFSAKIKDYLIPILSPIRQKQTKDKIYYNLNLFIQLCSLLTFVVNHLPSPSQNIFQTILKSIQKSINSNQILADYLSYLTLCHIVALSCLLLGLRQGDSLKMLNKKVAADRRMKLLNIITYVYLSWMLLVVPSFLVIINNCINNGKNNTILLWQFTIVINLIIIIIERKRILFKQYIILIAAASILLDNIILSSFVFVLALFAGLNETEFPKKVFYLQMVWFQANMFMLAEADEEISSFYLFAISIFILLIFIFGGRRKTRLSLLQQNQKIFNLLHALSKSLQLSLQEQSIILQILYNFEEELKKHGEVLNQEDSYLLQDVKTIRNKQTILSFLKLKIQREILWTDRSKEMQIQLIECKLMHNQFQMSILYEVEQLMRLSDGFDDFQIKLKLQTLIQKIQIDYLKIDDKVDGEFIIKLQNSRQKISGDLLLMVQKMHSFWKCLRDQKLTQTKAKQKLLSYINLQCSVRGQIQQLKQARNISQEILIYNCLIGMVNYNNEGNQIVDEKKSIYQVSLKLENSDYVLIQKNQIIGISINLANLFQLGQNQILGSTIFSLFPDMFRKYIANMLSNAADKANNGQSIILPFYSNLTSILIPKRTRIQILPSLKSGIKYIVHFYKEQKLRSTPYFLYSSQSDRILTLSVEFYQYFAIDPQQFNLDNVCKCYFGMQLGSIFKQNKNLRSSTVTCEMKLREKSVKRSQKRVQVDIVKIQQYMLGDQLVVLFQIRKRQNSDSIQSQSKRTLYQFLQCQKNDQKQAKSLQTFQTFCKIPNPFQGLLNQKIAGISGLHHFSYLKLIILLFTLMILLSSTLLILLQLNVSNKSTYVQTMMSISEHSNNKIQSLYLLIYQYYQFYQLKTYPDQFLQIDPTYNITQEVILYENKVQLNIHTLLKEELNQYVMQANNSMELVFKDYTILTNTATTNLIDFLQNFKYNLKSDNSQFVIRNQPALRHIINSFQQISMDGLHPYVIEDYYLIVFISAGIGFLIIAARLVQIRLHLVIRHIMSFYCCLSPKEVSSLQSNLSLFRYRIQNALFSIKTKKQNTNKTVYQKCKSIVMKVAEEKTKTSKQLDASTVNKDCVMGVKHSQQLLIDFLFSHNYACIGLVIFIIVFLAYYWQVRSYHSQSDQVFRYLNRMKEATSMVSQKAEKYYQAGIQELLPLQLRQSWQIPEQKNIPMRFDNALPSYFDGYKDYETSVLAQNLCKYSNQSVSSLYKNIDCLSVLNGALNIGFSQSFEMYLDLIQANGGVGMHQFANQFRSDAIYPVFMQICFIRNTLYKLMTGLTGQYKIKTDEFLQMWSNRLNLFLRCGWIFIVMFVVCGVITFQHIKVLCQIGIQSVNVIPRKIILKISVSKKMIRSNVLNQIQRLFL